MFVQVIKGRTNDPAGLRRQLDRWRDELKPGAVGFEGSTVGIADDGTFVAFVRFSDGDAAKVNSDRPEQNDWWQATASYFDGEPSFRESSRGARRSTNVMSPNNAMYSSCGPEKAADVSPLRAASSLVK